MTHRFAALIAGLAGLAATSPHVAVAAETWPAEDSQFAVDLQAFTSFASSQYQHTGDVFDLLDNPEIEGTGTDGSYQAVGLAIDAEFGVLPDLAFFVETKVARVSVISEYAAASVSGLGDLRLGGKWRAIDGAFTVTVAPAVKFPTGYTADPGPYMPSLGNGVNEYEARIWAGKQFHDAPFYFEVGSGYRFRGTRIPRGGGAKLTYGDEIPYDLEVGFDVTESLGLRLLLNGVVGLGTPETVRRIELQPVAQTYTLVGGGIGYRISDLFSVLATYQTTVTGVNALNSQFIGLTARANYGI